MATSGTSASATLLTVVTTALTLSMLYFAKEILLPFALAVLLSFLLTPLVRRLERLGASRTPAVLVVGLFAFALIGLVGWTVASQMIELSAKLPEYKGNLIEKVRTVTGATKSKIGKAAHALEEIGKELSADNEATASDDGKSEGAGPISEQKSAPDGRDEAGDKEPNRVPPSSTSTKPRDMSRLLQFLLSDGKRENQRPDRPSTTEEDAVAVKVVSLPPSPLQQVQAWLGPLVAPLTTGGVVVILTLFISLRREDMRNRIIQLFGAANLRATTEALDEATRRVSHVLRMQLLINSIYGAAVGLGLYFIGLPNAFLWGVLGTLLRFLPYIGPWIVAAMPITLSLAVFNDWAHMGLTIGLFLVLELAVNNVLEPWLYGASMGVSSVGIIVAAIFWTWLWGPVGLVIAMPLTACLVVAGNYIPQLRFLAILLGDEPALSLDQRLYQRLLALDDEEADRLIAESLHEKNREEFYEDVLIPALCRAEQDRQSGGLTELQEEMLFETAREVIHEFDEEHRDVNPHGNGRAFSGNRLHPAAEIICVADHGRADEVAAMMLCQSLGEQGFHGALRSGDTLASELVQFAETSHANAVFISAVAIGGGRRIRYLCKRLRAKLPDLPIIVGCWGRHPQPVVELRLKQAGATCIVSTLREASDAIQKMSRCAPATCH